MSRQRSAQPALLSILVVSYNTAQLTIQTLKSVFTALENSPTLRSATEIIVIDNNSKDESVSRIMQLQKEHRNLLLITNKKNTGFAAANNLGIERSTGEYILLLNSDTVVAPNALDKLMQSFTRAPSNESTAVLESHQYTLDNLGILAPALYNPDGSFQPQGGSFPSLFTLVSHMLFLDDLPLIGQFFPSTQHTGRRHRSYDNSKLIQKNWVAGTAMLVKRQVFDEVGLLDQNIFMYAEDIEFCLRARNHHYDIAIHPDAAVTHHQSASSSPARAIVGEMKGYLYIFAKHKPTWQLPLARAILILGIHLRRFLFGILLNNKQRSQAYTQALREL